jgi:bisphosphoglycerate-independent phosphoglycerate mutase (AlkP superfamily)
VLQPCGPRLGAEHSVQRYDSVVLEVLGFRGKVDMLVETVANHGNAESQQDSQRKNDRRFHHLHDDRMLLSLA